MTKLTLRRCLAAGAFAAFSVAALSRLSIAQTDKPAQDAASKSALSSAKTIQWKETFSIADQTGKLKPYFNVMAQLERPGKIRVELTPTAATGPQAGKTSFYVSDGKTQHEYNGFANKYTGGDAPGAGEQPTSQIASIAALDLILKPGQTPPPPTGTQRAVTKTTLDGKAMTLTTDTQPPRKAQDGSPVIIAEQTWTDAQTGLPYRRTESITQGGKTTVVQQLDFSDWAFDKPIPVAQFAWNPPAGATEMVVPKLLSVGATAPDFSANGADGKTVHLSDFKGKPVVLDFWATWCGPCQHSMPHLEKVYQQVKDKGVAVLALCVFDDKSAYDKWLTEKKGAYSFPTAFDPAGRSDKNIAAGLYGVNGIPTQYVIDKEGKVAAVNVGYDEGDTRLEEALNKIGVDIKVPEKKASAQ